eukprot:TRINITY_DN6275_c0_g1_i1.p1 TRINITY_DN6275_c0_g1~~TRINITY_DN6275_c0_g1_i1.p1  ORF type:complete len:291 (-),score=62.99 TRINITY_DN6275_c0_g1_i1:99-971(-)
MITLWKTVIDKETITAHMRGLLSGNERGLLGHWPINEGCGRQILDKTPFGHHGTIEGNETSWFLSPDATGEIEIPASKLIFDLKSILKSKIGADIKLISSNNQIILAHKIILASRSEAFNAMLYGGMKETHQEEIRFPDLQFEVLTIVVEYLYTDMAEINGETVVSVYMAADKYNLGRLRALCENYILQNIGLENVCTIFQTADHLGAEKLRGFCFNWIINNFGMILKSECFVHLAPELQKEINFAAADMHFPVVSKKRKFSDISSSSSSGNNSSNNSNSNTGAGGGGPM